MKKACFFIILASSSILGYALDNPFFLSSEAVLQEKQSSLKSLHSFVFVPLLKMEKKNVSETLELIDQELRKVGSVVVKSILTPEGADLESFSNPSLQFVIEQLVDQNNTPLPVLQAVLSVTTTAELCKSKEIESFNTNRWSIYLKKTNDVQDAIKQTLPSLLKKFLADFERANPSSQKPTFYIAYDKSYWDMPERKQP